VFADVMYMFTTEICGGQFIICLTTRPDNDENGNVEFMVRHQRFGDSDTPAVPDYSVKPETLDVTNVGHKFKISADVSVPAERIFVFGTILDSSNIFCSRINESASRETEVDDIIP